MVTFCTVNWRNYQQRGAQYTNILFDSIRRNLEEGTEGRFVVFTDDPDAGYAEGIETRPLPGNLQGWWNKLALFALDAFPAGERIVFLDLDTLITGPIDALAAYSGPFGILADFYRPLGLQSSVMCWEAGTLSSIWESYEQAGCPQDNPGGDQWWIEKYLIPKREHLQIQFPDMFVSYKVSGGALPQKASVVIFHGTPRPHEVLQGWVPRVWRVDGITHAELKNICNTAQEALLANVKKACQRPLDWFAPSDEHDAHVSIVGGGPSLCDKVDELSWRQSIGQYVWVLNNAHKALEGTGIKYDCQVLLDARPETAGFITDAASYLVSSQCDPSVFAALHGKPVTVWHANSPGMSDLAELAEERERYAYLVGGGTTVGMNALALAFLSGYRLIHLYGFDSCYRDGKHHAYPQALNDADRPIETVYGDKSYLCAPWMVGQAREFMEVVPGYMDDGLVVTVHGSGLLPDIGLGMLGLRSPSQTRADQVLARVPPGARGVEVGVFQGQMSAALLRGDPALQLVMVDSWEADGAAYEGDSGDWHAALGQAAQDEFAKAAEKRVAPFQERAAIWRTRSEEAAANFPDGAADFVFLDGDHSETGCRRDIAAWLPKVKPGGWLCGHDYENVDFPDFGVTAAVDAFVAAAGLELELGANFCWFVKVGKESEIAARRYDGKSGQPDQENKRARMSIGHLRRDLGPKEQR